MRIWDQFRHTAQQYQATRYIGLSNQNIAPNICLRVIGIVDIQETERQIAYTGDQQ